MQPRLEVRYKRAGTAAGAAVCAGLIGGLVYLTVVGTTPVAALVVIGVPLAFVMWVCCDLLLRATILVIDADGIEDRRAGVRLRWSEVRDVHLEVMHADGLSNDLRVEAIDPAVIEARARPRLLPFLPRILRAPFDLNIDGATTPVGEIVVHIERWWGRRVPRRHSLFGSEGAGHPQPRRASAALIAPERPRGQEPPLAVYPARGYWLRQGGFWLFWTIVEVGGGIVCAVDGDPRMYLLFAAVPFFARYAYKNLRFAFQRRPHFVIDSIGIHDPADPIPMRWADLAEIRLSTYELRKKQQHELVFEMHDFDGWLRHWDAAWEPGMTKKRPELPLRLPLGVPTSVSAEEILDRIEREWGRPFVREEDLLPVPALALEDRDEALAAGRAHGDQAPA